MMDMNCVLTNNYINDMNCGYELYITSNWRKDDTNCGYELCIGKQVDTNCGYELCIDKQLDK